MDSDDKDKRRGGGRKRDVRKDDYTGMCKVGNLDSKCKEKGGSF